MTTDTNFNIFRANDIRGEYPNEINEKIVSEIVQKFCQHFLLSQKPVIVIARDTRLSSPSFYRAAINSVKYQTPSARIVEVGLSTTPMFYFLVRKLKASGGIMITASHNPKNYNGLKIVDANAMPISGLEIRKLFNL